LHSLWIAAGETPPLSFWTADFMIKSNYQNIAHYQLINGIQAGRSAMRCALQQSHSFAYP
ncbi:MAG: hypothetical protein AB7O80_08050, partial [Acetobacteraceae bacterium]